MKKIFITGVLALALTAMSVGTFTSCKDTDEDLYNELKSQQVTNYADLLTLIQQLENSLADPETGIEAQIEAAINSLKSELLGEDPDLDAAINRLIQTWMEQNLKDEIKAVILSMKDELKGENGTNGKSAYELAVEKGYTGTLEEWLESLKGANGAPGAPGANGKSAYELAVEKGYTGTLEEWLESLKGANGTDGTGLTPEQATALIWLVEKLDDLKTLLANSGNSCSCEGLDALKDEVYGKDGKPGLKDYVENLNAWFEGIGLTADEFQEYVKQGEWVKSTKESIDSLLNAPAIKALDADVIEAINAFVNDGKLADVTTMYDTLFPDGTELPEGENWWNYAEVMQNIKNNSAAIAALQDDVKELFNRFNDMVTSLVLQATTNPVFGSVNTPFGINSLVLMTCYGDLATSVREFPVSYAAADYGVECYDGEYVDVDWSGITSDKYVFESKELVNTDANGMANLGKLWFTVNPGTVKNIDKNGFALVNSRDDDPVVKLSNVAKDNETVLTFGYGSRAEGNGNGLYQANAVIAPENLPNIKVNIQSGLASSLKDAVSNRTASDMVQLMKAVYNQLQDVCVANALRYSYEATTGRDALGKWVVEPQKVYSNYGIAATAYKPLSFAQFKGTSIRHIPHINGITVNKDLVDLNLGTFDIDSKNFSLNLHFGEPTFNDLGNVVVPVDQHVTLFDEEGNAVSGELHFTVDITDEANHIADTLEGAIMDWLKGEGEGNSLDERVDRSIWYALFNDPDAVDPKYPYDPEQPVGVVTDLLAQVNDMMGSIQDKLNDLVDKINNDYLNKVNRIIDKYNTVADKINRVLDDPNHYLQAVMLYRKAGKFSYNGGLSVPEVELPFAVLSTNPDQPTQFTGTGDAIRLWATTYSFETVAPAFKKMVGVVKVTKNGNIDCPELARAANASMAKVMGSGQNQVALDVKGAVNGVYTYELAYQALDYTGHTSTVKCYVQVKR